MRRAALAGAMALTLIALAALPAVADPIPGAMYIGSTPDGAYVRFTVSPDGTLVDSYTITGQFGTCQFYANGQAGVWQGAPIANNSFSYQLYTAIQFSGHFTGAQTAAGTFHLYNAATSTTKGCDTGVVSWTASTKAAPPSAGTGGTPPGGGGGKKKAFATRVTLHKSSTATLGGGLRSSSAACRRHRTVYLWRGRKRIATKRSKANGKFSFTRSSLVRGHSVRASVKVLQKGSAVCQAGSSTFIMG